MIRLVLVLATVLLLAAVAAGAPALPPELPDAARVRLQPVTEGASLSARVEAPPFTARPEVFEYLLDHPAFASHVTRALRYARYRIWPTPAGLQLDDGWGTQGRFEVVYAASGTRVLNATGYYDHAVLPRIHGRAVVVIEYRVTQEGDGRALITPTITGFVKLDSGFLSLVGALASGVAQRKADLEARRLVKVFAKTSRAIDEDPRAVYAKLRAQPDVPRPELGEFARLLNLP